MDERMDEQQKKARLQKLRRKVTVMSKLSALDQSDVLGSYTGTGQDGDAPEQDADDL